MGEPQSLTRAPFAIISVDPSSDATDNKVDFSRFVGGSRISSSIVWTGAGAAVLWYYPATPRETFTASEATFRGANAAPAGRGAESLAFAGTGSEWSIQAVGIDSASTAGAWKVVFT